MAKKVSRKITKKQTFRISPKNAEEILRQEFTTSKGDKIINIIRFKPQNPFKPDFTQTIEYKDKKKEKEKEKTNDRNSK